MPSFLQPINVVLRLLIVLLFPCVAHADNIVFEAEHNSTHNGVVQGVVELRSAASGGKTVYLHQGEYIEWTFSEDVAMDAPFLSTIMLTYANDGASDTLSFFLDDSYLGQVSTFAETDFGNFWNVPRDVSLSLSDPFALSQSPDSSAHVIKLVVTSSDSYGVEIDKILLVLSTKAPTIVPTAIYSITQVPSRSPTDVDRTSSPTGNPTQSPILSQLPTRAPTTTPSILPSSVSITTTPVVTTTAIISNSQADLSTDNSWWENASAGSKAAIIVIPIVLLLAGVFICYKMCATKKQKHAVSFDHVPKDQTNDVPKHVATPDPDAVQLTNTDKDQSDLNPDTANTDLINV